MIRAMGHNNESDGDDQMKFHDHRMEYHMKPKYHAWENVYGEHNLVQDRSIDTADQKAVYLQKVPRTRSWLLWTTTCRRK
jgi:hypothetical protein